MLEIKSANNEALEKALFTISATASCLDALTSAMMNPCAHWIVSRTVGQDVLNMMRELKCELARAITDAEAALDAP